MTEYGVSTRNKFAFLEEDASDPEEVLTKTLEIKKEASKEPSVPPKKGTTVVPQKPAAVTQQQQQSDRKPKDGIASPRTGPGAGQGRPQGQGQQPRQFPPRNNRYDGDQKDGQRPPARNFNNDRPPRLRSGDENAPPREGEDRGGRGPPRRFDGQGQGGRRFERRDGENNEGGENRGQGQRNGYQRRGGYQGQGQGNYNRGSGGQYRRRDGQEQNATTEDSTAEKSTVPTAENVSEKVEDSWGEFVETPAVTEQPATEQVEGEEKAIVNEEPVEPEPVVKTLEEWKAENKKAETPHFNLRKPGEGADQKIYQKLMPIKKEPTGKGKETDDDDDSHYHKEKREKALPIDILFSGSKRGGGGQDRGDRFDRGDRPPFNRRGGGQDGGGYRGDRDSGFRGDRGGNRGDRGEGGYRPRGGGPPRVPREGQGNTDRGGYRGGGRGGGDAGYSGGGYRGGSSGGGASSRPPPGFNLETEQFPALGAA